jgi:glucose dehydrogenase
MRSLIAPVKVHRPESVRRFRISTRIAGLILAAFPLTAAPVLSSGNDWASYLGDSGVSHYSPLRQIDTGNVSKLTVAWTYHAGGTDRNNRSQIQCNPLVIGGTLFGTSPDQQVFALDAATGRELWRFDPATVPGIAKGGVGAGHGEADHVLEVLVVLESPSPLPRLH